MSVLFEYKEKENILENTILNNINELNITPQQIQEFCDYFKSLDIPFNESTNGSKKVIDKDLEKIVGKEDKKKIDKEVNKTVLAIASDIKRFGLNSSVVSSINESLNDITELVFVSCAMRAKEKVVDQFPFSQEKILICLKLVLFIFITNSIICRALELFMGVFIGDRLGAVIVAPLVEELAKKIAAQNNCSTEFAVIFNSFEFTLYVSRYGSLIGYSKIALMRIVPVVMHVCTIIIQSISNNPKVLKALGLNKEKDKEKVSTAGYIIGVLIHSIYNSFCYLL